MVELDGGKEATVGECTRVGVDDVDVLESGSAGDAGGGVVVKRAPVTAEFGLGFNV